MFASIRARVGALNWFQRSILLGAVLTVLWTSANFQGLDGRLLRDGALFLVVPLAFGLVHGRRLGWRIDERAARNAALLSLFALPVYLIGSALPPVREYYPMFGLTSLALVEFLPYSVGQFVLVLAAETYYRGLLCVGLRDRGIWVVLVSPLLYAFHHAEKPPIELLLAGPADALFGAVDYDANSIFPSVCAHGLGLAVLDVLVLRPPVIPPETALRWLGWLPVPL